MGVPTATASLAMTILAARVRQSDPTGKSALLACAVSPDERGVAQRHERAVGCGGRDGALDETQLSRTAKSCGPGAPVLALSSQQQELLRVTVARKPVTGESTK